MDEEDEPGVVLELLFNEHDLHHYLDVEPFQELEQPVESAHLLNPLGALPRFLQNLEHLLDCHQGSFYLLFALDLAVLPLYPLDGVVDEDLLRVMLVLEVVDKHVVFGMQVLSSHNVVLNALHE